MLGFSFHESRIFVFKCMTWKVVRVLDSRCLFVIWCFCTSRVDSPLNDSRTWYYSQSSAASVAAAKWVDSWERLQFRFFLNLFSCLLITNLSRRNNTFSLSKEWQQRVNPRYIPRLFTQTHCHQRCSLDRDRMQINRFSLYDHDATQSECAHRLVWHGSMDIKVIVIWLPPLPPRG